MSQSNTQSESTNIPLIILHGWSIDSQNEQKWLDFVNEVRQKYSHIIFLPLPGLTNPLDEIWQLSNYEKWLAEQIKEYNKVILLGHSFGGQLAIRFAANHPQKVESLVLIDSAGIRDQSLFAKSKRAVFFAAAKIGKKITANETARKLLYKFAREKDYFTAPETQRKTMSLIVADEVRKDLKEIDCPVQIIWGENDTITPIKNANYLNERIKNSQLQIVTGARHSPQFTHPKETATLVTNFINR